MEVTLKTDQNKAIEEIDKTFDREWIKSTFLLTDKEFVDTSPNYEWVKKNRYASSADYKFTCTRPGMNIGVNPKPQFTRYCDIRSKGKIKNRPDVVIDQTASLADRTNSIGEYGLGMGRYYSEAIDDNQQRIFLRFGIPKFNFLSIWIADAFDVKRAIFMNRGTISTAFLQAVDITSMAFRIISFPLMSIGAFVLGALVTESRFYSVKPTMYLYWATVEDILNSFVARRTMLPHVLSSWVSRVDNKIGQEVTISESFIQDLNNLVPDIIDSKGRISVFALALKAQVAFNRMYKDDIEKNETEKLAENFINYPLKKDEDNHNTYFTGENSDPSIFTKYIFQKAANIFLEDKKTEKEETTDGKTGITNNLAFDESLIDPVTGKPIDISSAFDKDVDDPHQVVEDKKIENFKSSSGWLSKYSEYVLAELSEGAAFAIFNVDFTGSVNESFTNSFTSNPLATTFNSISSKARNITNLASTVTDIPVVGDLIKTVADAGAIVVSNASFGLANPILALFYGVNVEMPKMWESSSASLPRANYRIKLISPYGNPYSQLFNIYLPLSMILAGSLPRATGSASYTSPFVCQLFDRGRVNISLGMIDSVSITRGTSNLAFSRVGHPNAIDVDISVANMDEIISVDIASGGLIFDDLRKISQLMRSTPFTDYINTVAALDVYSQIYSLPKLRLGASEVLMKLNKYIEPDEAAFASATIDKLPGLGFLQRTILGNTVQAINDLTRGF